MRLLASCVCVFFLNPSAQFDTLTHSAHKHPIFSYFLLIFLLTDIILGPGVRAKSFTVCAQPLLAMGGSSPSDAKLWGVPGTQYEINEANAALIAEGGLATTDHSAVVADLELYHRD